MIMSEFSKSEDWLTLLLYTLDVVLNPKPHKYLDSFEWWDYQNRLRPQLYQLKRAKLVERRGSRANPTWGVTPLGRLRAFGGVEPPLRWQRPWDGKWRLLMFDLPARSHQLRVKLWRWLRSQRFGLLQRSLWISPDPVDEELLPLSRQKLMPKTAVVVEGQPVAPASNADFVKTAWDFAAINEGYRAALDQAAHGLKLAAKPDTKSSELRQWLALERAAWVKAVGQDPLLPEALLPSGYLGSEAWARRHEAYAALAKRGFRLP